MLTKLLFRTLPKHYPARSAYAHFPFLVPSRFESKMSERDSTLAAQYTWTRPNPKRMLGEFDFPRSVPGREKRMKLIAGSGDCQSKQVSFELCLLLANVR